MKQQQELRIKDYQNQGFKDEDIQLIFTPLSSLVRDKPALQRAAFVRDSYLSKVTLMNEEFAKSNPRERIYHEDNTSSKKPLGEDALESSVQETND